MHLHCLQTWSHDLIVKTVILVGLIAMHKTGCLGETRLVLQLIVSCKAFELLLLLLLLLLLSWSQPLNVVTLCQHQWLCFLQAFPWQTVSTSQPSQAAWHVTHNRYFCGQNLYIMCCCWLQHCLAQPIMFGACWKATTETNRVLMKPLG